MVFYRNTYNNTRGGNIFNDVPALCLYLSSPLYIFHKRPASSTQIFLRRSSKRFGIKYSVRTGKTLRNSPLPRISSQQGPQITTNLLLYGIGTGDGEIVTVALSQLGNVGGRPYWSWYGFESRVDWCACFCFLVRQRVRLSGHRRHPKVRKLLHRPPVVPGERTVAGPQL